MTGSAPDADLQGRTPAVPVFTHDEVGGAAAAM
jgi:hypothetical protein